MEDGDGDISVGAIAPVGELHIHNRNGAIHLTVPQGAGFQLQATARNGNIESKLNLPVSSAGEGQSVSGQVGGGGPRIELVADHGDIEIAGDGSPADSANAARAASPTCAARGGKIDAAPASPEGRGPARAARGSVGRSPLDRSPVDPRRPQTLMEAPPLESGLLTCGWSSASSTL